MAGTFNFTLDNLGSADAYTVQTLCTRLRMMEKDRTVATLAPFSVYVGGAAAAAQYQGGEEFALAYEPGFQPGSRPFSAELVGVASRVFTVIEE